jgi:hypothetical protein
VSADSVVPSAGKPQALNRYAYTFNNPLKYTDPTGHCPYLTPGCREQLLGLRHLFPFVKGGVRVYALKVAFDTATDTAMDAGMAAVTGDDFDLLSSVVINGGVDVVTGGVGGKAKHGAEAIAVINRLVSKGFAKEVVSKGLDRFVHSGTEVISGIKKAYGETGIFSKLPDAFKGKREWMLGTRTDQLEAAIPLGMNTLNNPAWTIEKITNGLPRQSKTEISSI